jgi:hypothetical protein
MDMAKVIGPARRVWERIRVIGDPLRGVEIEGERRITRKVGNEGHATLYHAERAEALRWPLLVKAYQLVGEDGPAELRDLPKREACASGRLSKTSAEHCIYRLESHGHALLCFGDREGTTTLGTWIRRTARRRWAPPAIFILEQIADVLRCMHEYDTVHRNLSSRSVIVPCPPEWRLVRVTDFSKARFLSGEYASLAAPAVGGAEGYRSPEQRAGDTSDGPPSDIYALGRLCYEVFLGYQPDDAFFEAPPSLHDLNRRVPSEFALLARACVAHRPSERPSAAELQQGFVAARVSSMDDAELPPSANDFAGELFPRDDEGARDREPS